MATEVLGFDGLPAVGACSLHRAICRDTHGEFCWRNDQRMAVPALEFQRAREESRLTAFANPLVVAAPVEAVLVAPDSFLMSDDVTLSRRSVPYRNDEPPFWWAPGTADELRVIAVGWATELLVYLRERWALGRDDAAAWLRFVRRLRSLATVTQRPKEREDLYRRMLAVAAIFPPLKAAIEWEVQHEFRLQSETLPQLRAEAEQTVAEWGKPQQRQSPAPHHRTASELLPN